MIRIRRGADLALLGVAEVRGIAPRPGPLDDELAATVADLRARLAGLSAGQIPHLQPARELYRAIGLDPTKRRPSPEALLRRLLRGDPFPRVHPAVDLGNLWAVVHGLPVGLYDVAALEGPLEGALEGALEGPLESPLESPLEGPLEGAIELRLGRPGESYPGIRKDEVHLEGRLVLADARGPFGNPSADSLRTSVHEGTRDLLYVVFAPLGYPAADLSRWLGWLAERTVPCLGATAEVGLG